MTPRHYLTLILLLTMSLWLSPVHSAQFRVALPNGELRASVTDLRVKVRGGQVSLERTWSNGRWYLNPAWADLKFRFNSEDGSVRYVDRAGAVYEKLGTGNVYVYDDRFFVAKTSTGWRWYDRAGNEVRYDAEGRVVSYADRHGNSVQLIRTAGRLTSVRDVRDREVLRFEYTGDRVTRVVDAADRSVSYTWSATGNLTEVLPPVGN